MEALSTIQKRNCLNTVFRNDEQGPGGGYHDYSICPVGFESQLELVHIEFQKGPRNDPNARHGVTDQDLLEIVRDRLKAFQAGSLPSRETACALTHIEEALIPAAKALLRAEIKEKVERYEPRVSVIGVTFEETGNGLIPTLEVEFLE